MTITVGLDVGGAHLKVARLDAGTPVEVAQFACPLWTGFEKLALALRQAMPLLSGASRVAVTMTGELSDLFESRAAGVGRIADFVESAFGDMATFYLGRDGFGSAGDARSHPERVGSMNYLATAQLAGRFHRDALLVDFGSTTVDIIAVRDGEPRLGGITDRERQTSGELVYTGLTRTAVMGVAQTAPLDGRWIGLAREYLATMADVRRVLGQDPGDLDQHATADGRGRSREESLVRLARMFGAEPDACTPAAWRVAAAFLRERQLQSITDGMLMVTSRTPLPAAAPVVVAGIGAGEAAEVARRLGRRAESIGALMGLSGDLETAVTHHAPAVAVALLSMPDGPGNA